jgi:hypothetical protein
VTDAYLEEFGPFEEPPLGALVKWAMRIGRRALASRLLALALPDALAQQYRRARAAAFRRFTKHQDPLRWGTETTRLVLEYAEAADKRESGKE